MGNAPSGAKPRRSGGAPAAAGGGGGGAKQAPAAAGARAAAARRPAAAAAPDTDGASTEWGAGGDGDGVGEDGSYDGDSIPSGYSDGSESGSPAPARAPEGLSDTLYAMACLLHCPTLRPQLDAYLASHPALTRAAAAKSFLDSLVAAQGDLEQAIVSPRRVEAGSAQLGPFDARAWALVDAALERFKGVADPLVAPAVRLIAEEVVAAEGEVRQLSNAFVAERGSSGGATWVRECPIEPEAAIEHVRTAKRVAVSVLGTFVLPGFARSPEGLRLRDSLTHAGYSEPPDLHPLHTSRLVAGDRLAAILGSFAAAALSVEEAQARAPQPAAAAGDAGSRVAAFEQAAALRRAAWLQRLSALADTLPNMISVSDMRRMGALRASARAPPP